LLATAHIGVPMSCVPIWLSGHQHIHERADVVKLFQTLHEFDHLAKILTLQHAIGAILKLVL
jgi:hypothetical protein